MKKLLSIVLAGTLAASMVAVGATAVGAEESGLAPGGYGTLGEYTPTAGVLTNHLMFAMPNAWQNATTADARCGGAAGMYWWTGYDTPDNKAGGHGWPGYKAVKEEGKGADNLWGMDIPTYGNGEEGDANQIIWNNYLDGGTETDKTKNPFYDAACQSVDSPGQYWSRADENKLYDPLFRYIYKKALVQAEVEGADALDTAADTFWEDANKLAAGEDWDKLKADEKTYQVDTVLDELEDFDLSEFGDYADNFFNEDLVGEADLFPREESQGFGEAFHFNNMVYVVNFDVSKMVKSPMSGKLGLGGNFYFYYGNGEYGAWPTKALCEEMGATVGNFTTGDYVTKTMEELMKEYDEYHKDDPVTTTVPSPSGTDAKSSTSGSSSGSSSNSSNGAVATGQVSMIVVLLVVLAAGIGIAVFTRKKEQ